MSSAAMGEYELLTLSPLRVEGIKISHEVLQIASSAVSAFEVKWVRAGLRNKRWAMFLDSKGNSGVFA